MLLRDLIKFLNFVFALLSIFIGYISIAAPAQSAHSLLPSFLNIFIPAKEDKQIPELTINFNPTISTNTNELITNSTNDLNTAKVKHGQDRLVFQDGTYVDGIFNQNRLLRGIYIAKDFTFEGTFKDNNEFDYGKLITIYGSIFEGFFQSGQLYQGHARIKYANGYIYNGEIQQGKHHGHGTLTFPDGNTFEGIFLDNVPTRGNLTHDGRITPVKFIDNKFVDEARANSL